MGGKMNAWTSGQEDREVEGWKTREWIDGAFPPPGMEAEELLEAATELPWRSTGWGRKSSQKLLAPTGRF